MKGPKTKLADVVFTKIIFFPGKIQVFRSKYIKKIRYREIKMTLILVFKLNREIKMLRNAKITKRYSDIKIPRKFHDAKIKVNYMLLFLVILKYVYLIKDQSHRMQ